MSNEKTGIEGSPSDLEKRIQAFGSNRRPKRLSQSFLEILWNSLQDLTLKILIVAAFASIAIEVSTAPPEHRNLAWIDGFGIFIAVLVCSMVASINDYQKEIQFQKLNNVADSRKRVNVIRHDHIKNLHFSELVVGDLVQIEEGMNIPADGFVIDASEVLTDESAMTGESELLKKETLESCIRKRNTVIEEGTKNMSNAHTLPSPILLSGTKIVSGVGFFLVIVVGDDSCVGKIESLLRSQEPEMTPLQKKLDSIANDIGKLGLSSAAFIIVVLLIRFTVDKIIEGWDNSKDWSYLLRIFIIGVIDLIQIAILVMAIPEGLPLSVTISLAFSVKKMQKDKNLVRQLRATETMGGVNIICTDKTGTLTMNKMSLYTIWNNKLRDIDQHSQKISLDEYVTPHSQEMFIQSLLVNNGAVIVRILNKLDNEKTGSNTDIAFLEFLERCGIELHHRRESYEIVKKIPFTSLRKRMSTIINTDSGHRLLTKGSNLKEGASEMLLENATFFHSFDGNIYTIDEPMRHLMKRAIEEMATKALRTICVAYREISFDEDLETKDSKNVYECEKHDLVVLGLFGIRDTLREKVKDSVLQCQKAGIRVIMITGDNKLTAEAIAKDCNIITPNMTRPLVIEGQEFNERVGGIIRAKEKGESDRISNMEEFDKITENLCVMARSKPEDKYGLVLGLVSKGNVVAVTGDGTNDAPALKKADVGFAMGISGTEVAREAADIILLDDNFSSIIKATLWGRNIYDSIRKFLKFQLTVNIVAVFTTILTSAIIKQEMITPIQMLWVNLIMDSLASLALATEPPTIDLLSRKPQSRHDYIISKVNCLT